MTHTLCYFEIVFYVMSHVKVFSQSNYDSAYAVYRVSFDTTLHLLFNEAYRFFVKRNFIKIS